MMPEPLRVLVCGSRTFTDREAVDAVLNGIAAATDRNLIVIHGAARGADRMAHDWTTLNDVPVLAFAANWNKYGKRAGFVRNSEMLEDGKPDVVWAFVDKPLSESKGTKMMVDIACKGGVTCYVVEKHQPLKGQGRHDTGVPD